MDKFFLIQIKRTNGNVEKGIAVKDSFDDARQGFHAYMAAYGYGHDANTDYVQSGVLNSKGLHLIGEVWEREPAPEPEQEA